MSYLQCIVRQKEPRKIYSIFYIMILQDTLIKLQNEFFFIIFVNYTHVKLFFRLQWYKIIIQYKETWENSQIHGN